MRMRVLMMVLALASATPLAARELAVPADKGWQHQETGLVLMSRLTGLQRTALSDTTQSEHDVAAQFTAPDESVIASVFLFKPAIADVALWFDRGATTLQANEVFRGAAPVSAAPLGFAAGGAPVASSLRQVYTKATGPYRSTALAVMPLGEWIVAVRMSAKSLSAEALDAGLMQLIGAIRWPAGAAGAGSGVAPANPPALAAVPVTACAAPLSFRKAKLLKSNTTDVLMQLIGTHAAREASASKERAPVQPSRWCREGEATSGYGIYRSDRNGAQGYAMVLGDAGRVVWVQPSLMGQIEKTGHYSVSLADVDGRTLAFPSFNGMPAPEQVWDLVGKGGPSATMNGNVMTIDPKTLR
jgi:hypothetical protein